MIDDLLPRPLFEADDPPGRPPDPGKEDKPKEEPKPEDKKEEPGPVPYDRFKEVNEARRKAEERLAKFEADEAARKKKEAEELGKWEELYKTSQAELEAERVARLRLEVASKKGIPPELAGRLNGKTAEELEADAEAMLVFLKEPSGGGVPPKGRGGGKAGGLDLSKMSPEDIRKNKAAILAADNQ